MSRTLSPSTQQLYGLARVAAAWGLPRSTYYARRDRWNHPAEPRKRGPKTPFTDAALTGRIRQEIAASPFTGEGHRKFWARLRVAGFHADAAAGLRRRHDHGSQFMSDDFQNEIRFLGIVSSPAFVREPEGNGCIERFFKTLKEQLESVPILVGN